MTEVEAYNAFIEIFVLLTMAGRTNMTQEEFISHHSCQIRRQSKGYWVNPLAKDYINSLKGTI